MEERGGDDDDDMGEAAADIAEVHQNALLTESDNEEVDVGIAVAEPHSLSHGVAEVNAENAINGGTGMNTEIDQGFHQIATKPEKIKSAEA